jgi:hypothetical protein
MRRFTVLGLLALAATALAVGATSANAKGKAGGETWRVTITNLTGGQPLSPPLLVTHSKKAQVWSEGEIASHGVAAIAEDANNEPLLSALPALEGVESVATQGGPIGPGGTGSYMVETSGNADRLSVLTMLVNTNDGFTGLDSFHLKGKGSTIETMVYDAGSEQNNQLDSHIPGPCCGNRFVRDPEGGLIRHHEGIIAGVGDLGPEAYGWDGAVARIVIERVS